MKQKIILILLSAVVLTSAFSINQINAFGLPDIPIGYGQGKNLNEKNVPQDALAFNQTFSNLNGYAVTPKEKQIILTFDQGYENGYTAKILDTLKEKHITAIFFLTGDYAKSENELVRRMIHEGHMLGNHTMNHKSIPTLDENSAQEEIISLQEYVSEVYNYDMQYFRFPSGEYSEDSIKLVNKLGLKTVFWSFAYEDWNTDSQPEPTESLDKIISSSHEGEILLLHSVSSTNAQILGNVIDELQAKGFIL